MRVMLELREVAAALSPEARRALLEVAYRMLEDQLDRPSTPEAPAGRNRTSTTVASS